MKVCQTQMTHLHFLRNSIVNEFIQMKSGRVVYSLTSISNSATVANLSPFAALNAWSLT